MIELRSDNAAGVAPEIIEAVVAANHGSALAYGGDDLTDALSNKIRVVFDDPELHAVPVLSGTAANALGLAAMAPPWGSIWCHHSAHIIVNECGASTSLSGGAVMHGVEGDEGLISVEHLTTALAAARWGDNHQSQPSVVSLTQPTDLGTLYPVNQISRLSQVAADHSMAVHLDGARLANAIAALQCDPAELTTKAGVQTFSLGATKNGAMSAEAIVTRDEAVANELFYRTKRAGHVTSKMRYQSAQLLAYLDENLWLRLASHANTMMSKLVAGIDQLELGERFERAYPAQVNMAFYRCASDTAQRLADAGLACYQMGDHIRFVTSWATTPGDVDRAIDIIGAAFSAPTATKR